MEGEAAYDSFLSTLFSQTRAGASKWSAEDTLRAMQHFGSPHAAFRSVHVAGTNGKGSVSIKVAAALQKQGYSTGLFISPHIRDFRERIQVNLEWVSKDFVVETGQRVIRELAAIGLKSSFFEVATMMAFLYFQQQRVDFAVVEVGIGGKLDVTNVITPEVSVISSIGYDHMNTLGNTLEEIAAHKAGIVKPGIPCVIGPNCPEHVFRQKCLSAESELHQVPDSPGSSFDDENNRVAIAALHVLRSRGFEISDDAIAAVQNAKQPFRFHREFICTKSGKRVDVVMDVGHNSSAVSRFLGDVEMTFPGRAFQSIVGMSSNKDIRSTLQLVVAKAQKVHSFSIPHPRLLPHNELHTILEGLDSLKAGRTGERELVDVVLNELENCDLVLMHGSCFIMADLYDELTTYEKVCSS